MSKKYLIPALLLPVALVSCNNDELVDDLYAGQDGKELIENVTLNVGFGDDASTRGAYAGASDKLLTNFVLEPSYDNDNKLELSDLTALRGDMIGLSLVSGENAVTNLPFYVAGYGSTPAANGKEKIYGFDQDNTLYTLSLNSEKQELVAPSTLTTDGAYTAIEASKSAIKAKKEGVALDADLMDVRKVMMRSNFPIVAGKYIAYYPYAENFIEAGAIPFKEIPGILAHSEGLSDSRAAAVTAFGLNDYLFACSKNLQDINGGTKSSKISLDPVTGAFIFKVYNSAKEGTEPSIKMITVETSVPEEGDFVLAGTYSVGTTRQLNATKTASMIGTSFTATTIENEGANGETNSGEGTKCKWAVIPCYINSTKADYVVKVYHNNNKVAKFKDVKPSALGVAKHYVIDLKGAEWEDAPLFAADAAGLKGIISTLDENSKATINLLADIEISNENYTIDKEITLVGGKLTLSGAGLKITKPLTADKLVLKTTNPTLSAKLTVTDLTVATGKTVGLSNGDAITSLTNEGTVNASSTKMTNVVNNGTFNVQYADGKSVEITGKLENSGAVSLIASGNADKHTTLTVGTLENKTASSSVIVNSQSKLAATVVTITAGTMTVSGETSAATVTNGGTLTWTSAKAMNLNVTNKGTFALNETCEFTGTLTNEKTVTVAADKTISGTSGSISNSVSAEALITINGTLRLVGTTLNVATGKLIDNGKLNGADYVTAPAGEMIKSVTTKQDLVAALGTIAMNQWYTGVSINGEITNAAAITTTKKFYLNADFGFGAANTVASSIGDVVVATNATLTAEGVGLTASSITINSGVTLTIGDGTMLTVTGKVTNNGEYKHTGTATVNCNGIAGDGTWTAEPNY